MTYRERIAYLFIAVIAVIVVIALSSCTTEDDVVVVTATPTQEVATWTPQPTDPPRTVMPNPHNPFSWITANHRLEGDPQITRVADVPDGRYQAHPPGFTVEWTQGYTDNEPLPPPWVHHAGDRYEVGLDYFAGSLCYKASPVTLYDGRYVIKAVIDTRVASEHQTSNITLYAAAHITSDYYNEQIVRLNTRDLAYNSRGVSEEHIWLMDVQDTVEVAASVCVSARHATTTGDSKFYFEQIGIQRVPDTWVGGYRIPPA